MNMKNCKTCFNEINDKANRCPYCTQWQSLSRLIIASPAFWFASIILAGYSVIIFSPSAPLSYEDFLDYREQINLSNTKIEFGKNGCKDVVAILGEVNNMTNLNLKDLHFDVSFYDTQNNFTDAFDVELSPFLLPASSVKEFKVSSEKEFPNEKYAKHKIKVSWAKKL